MRLLGCLVVVPFKYASNLKINMSYVCFQWNVATAHAYWTGVMLSVVEGREGARKQTKQCSSLYHATPRIVIKVSLSFLGE